MKIIYALVMFFIASSKLVGMALVGYLIYYIYNYGLDQLLTSLWKGFV